MGFVTYILSLVIYKGKPTVVIGVIGTLLISKLAQLEFQRMQLLDEQMSQLARVGAWEVDLKIIRFLVRYDKDYSQS